MMNKIIGILGAFIVAYCSSFSITAAEAAKDFAHNIVEARLAGEMIVTSRFNVNSAPLSSNLAIVHGDGRLQNGSGASPSGATFQNLMVFGSGLEAWVYFFSKDLHGNSNALLAGQNWNYAFSGKTTAGIAGSLAATGTFCNATTFSSYFCYSGVVAATNGAAAAPIGASTMTLVSAASLSPGMVLTAATGTSSGKCAIQTINSNVITFTSSGCITVQIAASATVYFSPPAYTSNFLSYLSAGCCASDNDLVENSYSAGQFSPLSDPSQVVIMAGGVFDSTVGMSYSQSIANWQAIFAAYRNAGKTLIVGDENPFGLATGYSAATSAMNGAPEVHTVPSTPTITLDYTNNIYNVYVASTTTPVVFYAPCGTNTAGTPASHNVGGTTDYNVCGATGSGLFVAGASDGVQLTNVSPASPTVAGQYSVNSSTGAITFSSADVGAKVAVYYTFRNPTTNSAVNTSLLAIHDWLASTSCAPFTGPLSGITLLPAGAQCPGLYPWVHVVSQWSQIVDPTSSTNYYNLPFTQVDGKNPTPYGGALLGIQYANAISALGLVPTANYTLPVTSNIYATANYANVGYGSPYSGSTNFGGVSSQCPVAQAARLAESYWATNLAPPASSGLYAVGAVIAPLAKNLPVGTTIVCVDRTNNGLLLSNSSNATVVGSTANWTMIQRDPNSVLANGVFDTLSADAQLTTASTVTGCGASPTYSSCPAPSFEIAASPTLAIPNAWALTLDAASQTAIANGTQGFGFAMEHNPLGDGYDDFVVQYQGYAGTGNLLTTLKQGINPFFGQTTPIQGPISNGSMWRGYCQAIVSAGPNGHLYGVMGPSLTLSANTGSTWSYPGQISGTATSTAYSATAGGGAVIELNDKNITIGTPGVKNITVNGNTFPALFLDLLTPPAITKSASSPSLTFSALVNAAQKDPISATIRFRRCSVIPASQ